MSEQGDNSAYLWRGGDTAASVAADNGITEEALRESNPALDLDQMREGDLIYMPEAVPAATAACTTGYTYTVQRGDTYTSIAAKLGTTAATLQALNPTIPATRIPIGYSLCVPSGLGTPECTRTYIVQRGDTYISIAAKLGTTAATLQALNPTIPARRIPIGYALCVPGTPEPLPECTNTYIVQRGDTYTSIAAKLGTTAAILQALNPTIPATRIPIGYALCVPVDASCPATYIVQRGDTYTSIAARLGTTAAVLQAMNPTIPATRIPIGYALCVPSNPCPATYIVRRGDTYTSIAARLGTTAAVLQAMNPTIPATRIPIGYALCVPASVPATAQPCGDTHTVTEGETFETIAAAYGVTVRALSDANPFVDPAELTEGTVLCLPASEGGECESGTVQPGQSYTDLLIQNDVSYLAFRAANPDLMPGRLRAGMRYCVPPEDLKGINCQQGQPYEMAEGDTLESVAQSRGVSEGRLLRLNPCLPPSGFVPGKTICL